MIFFALVLKHERGHVIFHIICSSAALKHSLAKMQKSTYLLKFFPTLLSFLPRIIHFNELLTFFTIVILNAQFCCLKTHGYYAIRFYRE